MQEGMAGELDDDAVRQGPADIYKYNRWANYRYRYGYKHRHEDRHKHGYEHMHGHERRHKYGYEHKHGQKHKPGRKREHKREHKHSDVLGSAAGDVRNESERSERRSSGLCPAVRSGIGSGVHPSPSAIVVTSIPSRGRGFGGVLGGAASIADARRAEDLYLYQPAYGPAEQGSWPTHG